MAWRPDAVNIWTEKSPVHYCSSGPVRDYKTSQETGKPTRVQNNSDGSFIVRIHSKNCPINVNLRDKWAPRPRNYRFTIKPEAFNMYPELDETKYGMYIDRFER
jgi:hypothetical protein